MIRKPHSASSNRATPDRPATHNGVPEVGAGLLTRAGCTVPKSVSRQSRSPRRDCLASRRFSRVRGFPRARHIATGEFGPCPSRHYQPPTVSSVASQTPTAERTPPAPPARHCRALSSPPSGDPFPIGASVRVALVLSGGRSPVRRPPSRVGPPPAVPNPAPTAATPRPRPTVSGCGARQGRSPRFDRPDNVLSQFPRLQGRA